MTRRPKQPRAASSAWSAPPASIGNLKSAIDRVLDIRFVEWSQVDAYIALLEGALADIVALGAKSPSDALDVTLYFIHAIPSIFDSIHDETELAMFCQDLCAAALALQRNAGCPLSAVAAKLLDAFLEDDHGRFQEIPKQLASHCQSEERAWLRAEATRRSAAAEPYKRALLGAITAPTATGTGGRSRRTR